MRHPHLICVNNRIVDDVNESIRLSGTRNTHTLVTDGQSSRNPLYICECIVSDSHICHRLPKYQSSVPLSALPDELVADPEIVIESTLCLECWTSCVNVVQCHSTDQGDVYQAVLYQSVHSITHKEHHLLKMEGTVSDVEPSFWLRVRHY